MNNQLTVQLPVTVLIADDDSMSRLMLKHLLEQDGYTVEEASDGEEALDLLHQVHPDLVLLDAIMPYKDGFTLCAEIQTFHPAERVPVLIITGLDDPDSINRAFQVGAVDYINKPINWYVLRQRVRRIIATQQLQRLRDDLIQMIVHDMKNPLSTIRGFAEVLLSEAGEDPVVNDSLARIYHSSSNLLDMTMMILDIGRLEEGKITPQLAYQPMCEMLTEVKDNFEWMASNYHIQIVLDACDDSLNFPLDRGLIQRVIGNLLSNAIKHSPPESSVLIGCRYESAILQIFVSDQGEGIQEQDKEKIFEKFSQATHRKRGNHLDTGLGLTFCKLATEAHGGKIEVESTVNLGSTFTIVLPDPSK